MGLVIASGWTLLVALFTPFVPHACAQSTLEGSVRVATDHWSNEYVRRLRERGFLPGLNPLVQPWRARDVAHELAQIDPDTLREPVRGWVGLLRTVYGWRAATDRASKIRGGGMVAGGIRASTSQRLGPLRPLGDSGGVWPRAQAGGWIEGGPIVAEARVLGDTYLSDDPDGLDPGQQRGVRSDHAYVAIDTKWVSAELGRISRNWSLPDRHGLMVSDVATPYPSIAFEFRAWRLALRAFSAELDTVGGRRRYFAGHRIDYATEDFVASIGESNVYVTEPQGGGLSLRFLNPVELFFFDSGAYESVQNLMLNGQVWWRIPPLVFNAEFLLDDIDVTPGSSVAEPIVYAFTLDARMPSPTPWLSLGARYEQVSAWAYRTPNEVDQYSFLRRGLGQNFSDYGLLQLGADLYPPVRGLWFTPVMQYLRQGEGDFRDPIIGGYAGRPAIFLGVVEETVRGGLRGRYQPVPYAWLAWDVGYDWIRNRNHVHGAVENLFSAGAELGVRIDFPFRSAR